MDTNRRAELITQLKKMIIVNPKQGETLEQAHARTEAFLSLAVDSLASSAPQLVEGKVRLMMGDRRPHHYDDGELHGFVAEPNPEAKPGERPFTFRKATEEDYLTANQILVTGIDSGGEKYAQLYLSMLFAFPQLIRGKVVFHDHGLSLEERIAIIKGTDSESNFTSPGPSLFADKVLLPRAIQRDNDIVIFEHSFAVAFGRAAENRLRQGYSDWIQKTFAPELARMENPADRTRFIGDQVQMSFDNMMRLSFGYPLIEHGVERAGGPAMPGAYFTALNDMMAPLNKVASSVIATLREDKSRMVAASPFIGSRRVMCMFADTPVEVYPSPRVETSKPFINVMGHGFASLLGAAMQRVDIVGDLMQAMHDVDARASFARRRLPITLDPSKKLEGPDAGVAEVLYNYMVRLATEDRYWSYTARAHPMNRSSGATPPRG